MIHNGIKHFTIFHPRTIIHNHSEEAPYLFNGIVLGLCTQGEATIQINFKEYHLTPHTTLVVLPSQAFKIVKRSDDFQLSSLLFSLDFFVGLVPPNSFDILFRIAVKPCQKVSPELMESLLRYHQAIVKQYHDNTKFFRIQIIRGLLYALFLEVGSLYKIGRKEDATGQTRQEKVTMKFFELLMDHYKKERDIDYYADKLCITKKYLSSIVKKVTGYTVRKWIDEIIITEAKIRLKTSDLSVLQIADELNFPNASFFGQYFKKRTRMTPHKFRKS
jgi:AraC-like DNA-binding protein